MGTIKSKKCHSNFHRIFSLFFRDKFPYTFQKIKNLARHYFSLAFTLRFLTFHFSHSHSATAGPRKARDVGPSGRGISLGINRKYLL
jgi:hypothetical protein